MSACLEAALWYARHFGWYVLPIDPASKLPATRHAMWEGDPADCPEGMCPAGECGYKHASNDPEVIREWWAENPNYWLAIALDVSGMAVVDVDPRNGGSTPEGLPSTWEERTGAGGLHFYFTVPQGVDLPHTLGPGVDLKYHGYAVCAPSPGYRWLLPAGRIAAWPGRTFKGKDTYGGPVAAPYSGLDDCSPEATEYLKPYMQRLVQACIDGHGRNDALYLLCRTAGQLVKGGEAKQKETLEWLHSLGPKFKLSRTRSTVRSGFFAGLRRDKPLTLTQTIDGTTLRRVNERSVA